ncbi:hypothetical protein [uncultured Thiothrix sp.]|uniref:hypothetical protein n=1 Tax=uncultured Thiothrix sp. TaxID=223185 RepID=UPI00261DC3E9|nr:hypothetical protein [uncultured Thiothrix sp.]
MDIATPTARRSLREPIAALALFIGGLAWIAAFWFPSFYTSQGPVEGYWVFATGWMGFAIFQFAWYANLLMLLGIILMYSSPLWGSSLAGFAVLVATQAFWFNSIPTGEVDLPILQLGQGFWCWYGSIVLLGLGVFLGSEQTEAEKNQTTKSNHLTATEPQFKKTLPQTTASTTTVLTPVLASKPIQLTASEEVYDAVIKQPELIVDPVVASVVEQELTPVSAVVTESEPEPIPAPPFAVVPEPELPNFAELTAANEQEYFQLADEVALKPVYTERLAEDWPPKMSLVVSPDPFTTERYLDTELLDAVEQANATVKPKLEEASMPAPITVPPQQAAAGFFDPWRT